MRKSRCRNCMQPIFRPVGRSTWFHESPRWRKCCVQQYEGWYPEAEPFPDIKVEWVCGPAPDRDSIKRILSEERMQIAAEMSKL